MSDLFMLAVSIIILIVYSISYFKLIKQKTAVTMEKEVKQAILSLFLYAEKQGWTGEAKMAYVAHKIHDVIPGETLRFVIKETQIESYLQDMYDMLKEQLYY